MEVIKILTDREILEIMSKAASSEAGSEGALIDDSDQLGEFYQDIAKVLTKHFGGEVGNWSEESEEDLGYHNGYSVAIYWNEEVPIDGGVWTQFDKDVNEEWLEACKDSE